jgi:YfiH family protein
MTTNTPWQDTSWLQADGWQHIPGLVHGFSNRICNRENALRQLKADELRLHTLKQVHGDRIVIITPLSSSAERPEADGLLSSEPGALLGIVTADCVPVLMVAPRKRIAAALHAGWRGTLKGITLQAIEILYSQWNVDAQELRVALGPSIGGCCYEVGPEVGTEIVERWNIRSVSAWRPVNGKGLLDLREVTVIQMMERGVPGANIALTGPCTFCDSSFASYRREGASAGRQLSVIGWRKI